MSVLDDGVCEWESGELLGLVFYLSLLGFDADPFVPNVEPEMHAIGMASRSRWTNWEPMDMGEWLRSARGRPRRTPHKLRPARSRPRSAVRWRGRTGRSP